MNKSEKLFRTATGFHKTTCLLASKYTGILEFNPEEHLPFPILYKDDTGTLYRATIKDSNADENWMKDADSYFTAMLVNGAFSLELHLKHLYALVEKKDARGHDLHKLFIGLSDYTKNTLESLFQEISDSQPMIQLAFNALNDELKIKRQWTIENVLKDTSRAFEIWRYSYEEKEEGSTRRSVHFLLQDVVLEML